jgi:hypothetical protein
MAKDGSKRKGGETMTQAMTKRIRAKAQAALFVALVVFGDPTVEAASASIIAPTTNIKYVCIMTHHAKDDKA